MNNEEGALKPSEMLCVYLDHALRGHLRLSDDVLEVLSFHHLNRFSHLCQETMSQLVSLFAFVVNKDNFHAYYRLVAGGSPCLP